MLARLPSQPCLQRRATAKTSLQPPAKPSWRAKGTPQSRLPGVAAALKSQLKAIRAILADIAKIDLGKDF